VNLPKTLTAAFMRELRMLVTSKVLAPWQAREILGAPQRPGSSDGERVVKPSEAGLLFSAIRAKLERQAAEAAERERLQGHLSFGGEK
jgi:hypothetical protein